MGCRDKFKVENVSKSLCVVLLVLQTCILNYYLIENDSIAWIGFVVIDITVIVLWITALYMAMKKHRRKQQEASSSPDELRIAYIAWLVYAVGYTIQISFIFKNFAHKLDNAKTTSIFGQNMLKLSLTFTPMLFLLLVHAHHDAAPNTFRKFYVQRLTGGVTIDLMDSIEILEVLFREPTDINLPPALENAIVAFACINVFLPTLALHALKQKKLWFSAFLPSNVLYNLCYIFLVNVPFFVIRIVLWASYEQDVSVFLAKNVILIVMNSWDVVEHFCRHAQDESNLSASPELALKDLCRHSEPSVTPGGKDDKTVSHDTDDNILSEMANLNEVEESNIGYV